MIEEIALPLAGQIEVSVSLEQTHLDQDLSQLRSFPVRAGHGSMLPNLSGASGPFFARNVVFLKDSAGRMSACGSAGRKP